MTRDGEPVVPLVLLGKRRPKTVSAVIDTGFNGDISVPEPVARRLGWKLWGFEEYEVATGELTVQPVYPSVVRFGGRSKTVLSVASQSAD